MGPNCERLYDRRQRALGRGRDWRGRHAGDGLHRGEALQVPGAQPQPRGHVAGPPAQRVDLEPLDGAVVIRQDPPGPIGVRLP